MKEGIQTAMSEWLMIASMGCPVRQFMIEAIFTHMMEQHLCVEGRMERKQSTHAQEGRIRTKSLREKHMRDEGGGGFGWLRAIFAIRFLVKATLPHTDHQITGGRVH